MYDEYYGFSGKPFQLTPDHKFFFNSKSHNRAMAYLRYGLEQGEGFIVITGGIGTGKTMLVRNLFNELTHRNVMAAQLVTTQVDPEDMLRMVCASFGLAHEGLNKATMLHNLEAIARARHSEGKRVLLVVDEAQNLPARSVEELRMLSNFQVDGQALFQSFLLGQEEFKRTLQGSGMEQVRQRIIASYHLDPLGLEETRRYIEHRLKQVSWDNDPSFDDDVFKGIFEFAEGVPRRINNLCDRLLLYGCLEELHHLDRQALDTVSEEIRHETSQMRQKDADLETPRHLASSTNTATPDSMPRKVPSDLVDRLAALEMEIENLKQTVQKERKLLRKAILLQMEMDEYDEL